MGDSVTHSTCVDAEPMPVTPQIRYPIYSDLTQMNWTVQVEMNLTMSHLRDFSESILEESIAMVAGTSRVDVTNTSFSVTMEIELGGVLPQDFGIQQANIFRQGVEQRLGLNVENANESCTPTASAICAAVQMPLGRLVQEKTNATRNRLACSNAGLYEASKPRGYGVPPPPPIPPSLCTYQGVVDSVEEECNATARANCAVVDISDPAVAVINCHSVKGCIYTYDDNELPLCVAADYDACSSVCIACSDDTETSRRECLHAGGGRDDGTPSTCTYTAKVWPVEEDCVPTARYSCAAADISGNETTSRLNCNSAASGWCTYIPQGTAHVIGSGSVTSIHDSAATVSGRRRLQTRRSRLLLTVATSTLSTAQLAQSQLEVVSTTNLQEPNWVKDAVLEAGVGAMKYGTMVLSQSPSATAKISFAVGADFGGEAKFLALRLIEKISDGTLGRRLRNAGLSGGQPIVATLQSIVTPGLQPEPEPEPEPEPAQTVSQPPTTQPEPALQLSPEPEPQMHVPNEPRQTLIRSIEQWLGDSFGLSGPMGLVVVALIGVPAMVLVANLVNFAVRQIFCPRSKAAHIAPDIGSSLEMGRRYNDRKYAEMSFLKKASQYGPQKLQMNGEQDLADRSVVLDNRLSNSRPTSPSISAIVNAPEAKRRTLSPLRPEAANDLPLAAIREDDEENTNFLQTGRCKCGCHSSDGWRSLLLFLDVTAEAVLLLIHYQFDWRLLCQRELGWTGLVELGPNVTSSSSDIASAVGDLFCLAVVRLVVVGAMVACRPHWATKSSAFCVVCLLYVAIKAASWYTGAWTAVVITQYVVATVAGGLSASGLLLASQHRGIAASRYQRDEGQHWTAQRRRVGLGTHQPSSRLSRAIALVHKWRWKRAVGIRAP